MISLWEGFWLQARETSNLSKKSVYWKAIKWVTAPKETCKEERGRGRGSFIDPSHRSPWVICASWEKTSVYCVFHPEALYSGFQGQGKGIGYHTTAQCRRGKQMRALTSRKGSEYLTTKRPVQTPRTANCTRLLTSICTYSSQTGRVWTFFLSYLFRFGNC